MSWTRPRDFRTQLEKLWERGDMLSSLVTGESLFPRRLILKCPTSAEMADRFDEVRAWVREIRAVPHCRVVAREFNHRILGMNSVPAEVWIDSFDVAATFLSKRKDAARFVALIEETKQSQPKLLGWLARRPMLALALADDWNRLLEIVVWMQAHPRPGVYLRQVDIPGVHSKFIEAQRSVLTELFDMALDPETVDFNASGVSGFATRYGFRDKPLRIRFRLLDPDQTPSAHVPDITLDAASFAQLNPMVLRVFIIENEINFLAFPPLKGSLVIFGAGYGFEMSRHANWLSRCRIYYWGDIDTHGFAILDQLRNQFAHVESLLMDRATLLKFEPLWGEEEKQTLRDLPRLTPEELSLYNDLRDNRIRKNIRLEQERIGFGWFEAALKRLLDSR
ncbi:Wadjet anti-phage system protein JetD domain-containing protein [Candidatus Nitrotoga sp. AM1P]|uniref:Wadjet anti-phage system protein JetD domain-containing protein n=1 Tax=Candidatus Nitrotoga sp. AM1P TaxID=2559597 RepID=UPI0010B47190|nr:Wadjet anti-phage system protein JetD domain-containing protein [Candidatus Nitrotoga sp. AM1P]BBJ23095.1 hypothetical protein W01_10220 [Candidatus Nitrotoga sp. AM1P]